MPEPESRAFSPLSPVFVGRNDELSRLLEVADRVESGEAGAILVGGEAGVGKTRLLVEAGRGLSARGWQVLTGQCAEAGLEGSGLAPLVEVLRTLSRTASPAELEEILGSARPALARLLPQLGDPSTTVFQMPASGSAQLFELFLGVLDRLAARHPLALVIEDAHWADPSTLDLLVFLVRALRDVRVLLVISFRSDELPRRHPLRPLLAGWERVRSVDRLQLNAFDQSEVQEMLSALLADQVAQGLVQAVYDRSEGNAFLVEEIAGAVRRGGTVADLPQSLRDVLLTRLDALDEPTQRVVRTVSAAGGPVSDGLLAAVAGLERPELFAALRQAVEHHLLVVDEAGRGYSFRHALTREAVYEDMLPGERGALHQAYAEVLDDAPAHTGDASLAARVAHHWYAAYDLPKALPALVSAGRHAAETFAPADAQQHLERALEIWPKVPDAQTRTGVDHVELLGLAAEAALAGGIERARGLLDQALAELDPGEPPERRALLMERRARAIRDLGHEEQSIQVLRDALALLPTTPASRTRAVVLASLAGSLMRVANIAEAAQVAEEAVEVAVEVAARPQEADARITLGHVQVSSGSTEPGLTSLVEGLRAALELRVPETALRGYINLSDAYETLGRHTEAISVATEGVSYAADVGFARTLGAYLSGNLAEPLLRLGRWSEAERVTTEALSIDPEGGFASTLLVVRAELAVLAGRYADARRYVADARRRIGLLVDDQFSAPLLFTEAEAARATGDLTAAAALVASFEVSDPLAWSARYTWPVVWLGSRIRADLAQQAKDTRSPVPDTSSWASLADLSRQLPTGTLAARAYSALRAAEEARQSGNETDAWALAVASWRDTGEPYLLAYALLRRAEAQCAGGEREAASHAVREAYGIAQDLGAGPLVAEIEALSRRARLQLGSAEGPTVDAIEGSGAGPDPLATWGLTEREREVLLLLATGRSNPEIATTLFISPKTPSVHVSNILAKLGVSSRVQAAGLVHRLGLLPGASSERS